MNLKLGTIVTIVSFVTIYLAFSFVAMALDPFEWDLAGRLAYIMISIGVAFVAVSYPGWKDWIDQ